MGRKQKGKHSRVIPLSKDIENASLEKKKRGVFSEGENLRQGMAKHKAGTKELSL